MRKKLTALLIFAVALASGCVNQNQTIEASADVLSFGEISVVPNPPIFAGDTFSTSLQITNLDELEDAKNVKLTLYDWGVCKPQSCSPDSKEWGFGSNQDYLYVKQFGDIPPRDMKFIECQFKAPSNAEIGGIKTSCPIKFKLSYDFESTTTTDLTLISEDKFRDLQKSGKTPSATSTQTKSRGPVKIDFEFLAEQPVMVSKDVNKKIPFYIRIENKGTGEPTMGGLSVDALVSGEPHTFFIDVPLNLKTGYQLKLKEANLQDKPFAIFEVISPSGKTEEYDIEESKGKESKIQTLPDGTTLEVKKINDRGKLTLKIPKALTSNDCKLSCTKQFNSENQDGNCIFTLKPEEKIKFVKGKSEPIRCELTAPKACGETATDGCIRDEKTFYISGNVAYTYEIDKKITVDIKPVKGV